MFGVLFYLLFVLLVSSHRCLDVMLFKKIQEYEENTLSSSKQEARQVTLDHNSSYVLSFSSIYTGMHALILLPKPHTLGIWVHTWIGMLSHAVMSVMQVFHPL
jgi:hypothetical protein